MFCMSLITWTIYKLTLQIKKTRNQSLTTNKKEMSSFSLRVFSAAIDGKNFTNTHLGDFECQSEHCYRYRLTNLANYDWKTQKLQIYPGNRRKTLYPLEPDEMITVLCFNPATANFVSCGKTMFKDVYLYFTPPTAIETCDILLVVCKQADDPLTFLSL